MKTKLSIFLFSLCFLVCSSCKKDTPNKEDSEIINTQLDAVSENISNIFSGISGLMNDALLIAADSGMFFTQPPASAKSVKINKTGAFISMEPGEGWYGPDADGWYYRTMDGVYTYKEQCRCTDSTMTYILTIESSDDNSYSCVYTTDYKRYIRNDQIFYEGYADWNQETFSNNSISSVQWRFDFSDWDPETGAGVYNWYWGVHSLGSNAVPYHRFLNIIATEVNDFLDITPSYLHVKVTWYDGIIEGWKFEYDTDLSPVEMPVVPCWVGNDAF